MTLKGKDTQFTMHPWLSWIERVPPEDETRGSNPLGCAISQFMPFAFVAEIDLNCGLWQYRGNHQQALW